ncbi:MAG: PQQ-binding-like beta-propeller repeat protein [Verrucomicrobiota bacterium]
MLTSIIEGSIHLAVVPILIGPLQVLLAILPAILVAIGGVIAAMLKPASIKIGLQVLWRNKIPTLAIVAVIGGACYGFSYLHGFGGGKAAAFQGKTEWAMYRGGLDRRGGGRDGAPDPVGGGEVWAFAQKFKTYYSSPAIIGNRIVAGAAKKEVFADRGGIYCLDAQSGAMVWEFAPSDFRATYSSPAVSGKYVVCGEGLHLTTDARIFCLSFETGKKLWEVKSASHVESSPCIYTNMVFCGAGADGVYAMRLDTPPGKSPVVWHLKSFRDMGLDSANTFHCDSSLAAVNGRVYFTSAELHDGDWSGIACVDAATGKCIWKVDTSMPVWGSPTIISNRLFVGMGNGNMVESAEQYWARKQQELRKAGKSPKEISALAPKYAAGGELWAIDAITGKTNWVRKLGKTMLGTVAVADDRLYFAGSDGIFTCITMDNELLGQWDAHEPINTCPAVGSNHVYVATDSGRFFGLDRRTLKPVWQTRLGNGALFSSSPALGFGHIYIGTPERGLVCMGSPADQQIEMVWNGARGGHGNYGSVDGSFLPAKGSYSDRWPKDFEGDLPPVSGSLACLNNTLYVPVTFGSQTGLAAMAVSSTSSKLPETNQWFAATVLPIAGAVAATTSRVYFVEGKIGDAGRKLHCVDAVSGKDTWQATVDAGASGELLLTTSHLFLFGRNGELSCLATKGADAGKTIWSTPVGAGIGVPCLIGDIVAIATKEGVAALQSSTGKPLWKQSSPKAPVTGPAANEDVVVVATADGLAGLSIVNGATLWSLKCAPSSAPLVTDDKRVLCTTADGEIKAVGWDGKELFHLANAIPGMPAMLLGDKLLFCAQGEFTAVDLSAKNEESRWLEITPDFLGKVIAPPILANGFVYFVTDQKGLVSTKQGKR